MLEETDFLDDPGFNVMDGIIGRGDSDSNVPLLVLLESFSNDGAVTRRGLVPVGFAAGELGAE